VFNSSHILFAQLSLHKSEISWSFGTTIDQADDYPKE